jgi:cation transport ATPase
VSLKLPVEETRAPAVFGRTRQVGDALDLLAALIAVALIVLVSRGWTGPPRVLLALGFAFFVPGRAIVTNWRQTANWSEVAMPMLFSLALLTLVAMVALWAHYWHPLGIFQVEAVVSLALLGVGVARRHRRRTGTDARQAKTW